MLKNGIKADFTYSYGLKLSRFINAHVKLVNNENLSLKVGF